MKSSKHIYLSLMTVVVLLVQLMSPALVHADDETPAPPSDAPIETTIPEVTEAPTDVPATEPPTADALSSTPEPTESFTTDTETATDEPVETNTVEPTEPTTATESPAPPATDSATEFPTESLTPDPSLTTSAAATEVPTDLVDNGSDAPTPVPVESSTPTPEQTETLEVTLSQAESAETATPADATVTVTEEPTLLEVQQVIPDGTSIVVLDENGQPLPLVTQESADIITNGDPMWCPSGVTPIANTGGCTSSYASLGSLLSDLGAINSGSGIGADGTIWIEASYDSAVNDPAATGFALDGSALTTWAQYSLGLQGGWSGIPGDTTITSNSLFSVPITISNWHNTVYIANVTTTSDLNVDNTDGVVILADVDAGTNNINIDRQKGRVDIYNSTGNLNVTNADINNNGLFSSGINVHTLNGDVTISNSSFHGNGYDGIWMNGVNNVFINQSTFFQNGNNGIGIYNANNIFIDNSMSYQNANNGMDISGLNTVTVSNSTFSQNGGHGVAISQAGNVTATKSAFNNNLFHGIYVSNTTGDVTLQNITATASAGTYGDGAYIDNTWGTGNVTLTGTNDFSNHSPGNSGMFILSNGDVSLSGITSNTNGRGVNISQAANVSITGGLFNDNCCNYEGTGAYVFANGAVSISQSIFNGNSLYINTIGDVGVDNVTVDHSPGFGLGVDSFGGNVTINNSRFTNSVPNGNDYLFPYGDGADIFPYGGNVSVTNSEFSGNEWGLWVVDGGQVTIANTKFDTTTPPMNKVDLAIWCTLNYLGLSFPESLPINFSVNPDCTYPNPPVTVVNGTKQEVPVIDQTGTVIANANARSRLTFTTSRSNIPKYHGKAEFWLDCAQQYNFKINLPNGDRVDIYCPVSGKARITRLDNTTLPRELPTGYMFASAFQVEILQPIIPLTWDPSINDYDRKPVPVIAEGGHITASFVAPPLQPGKSFTILYWDETSFKWIPLKDFLFGRQFQLSSNDPESRTIISGVLSRFQKVPRRVEVSTNFPGIFVLAQH